MTEKRSHLINWLRDAYAMEQHAIEMLETQADRILNYPELKDRISQHAEETRYQTDRLRQCLNSMGEDISPFRTGIGNYKILITAAHDAGEHRIAAICGEILQEQEAMASWLEHNLPLVTQAFLQKDMSGTGAKR